MKVIEAIARDPVVGRIADALADARGPVGVSGLWGSCAPILAGAVARAAGRPLLYVTAHLEDADHAQDDIETCYGQTPELLAAWEALPGEGTGSGEIGAARSRLCGRLASGESVRTIVTPIQALMQAVPTPAALSAHALELRIGQSIPPRQVAEWLVARGMNRLDQVEEPGDFALRGGILDVFHTADVDPVRIEFFGDQIESIREFEPGSQRSTRALDRIRLSLAPPPSLQHGETTSFFNFLPRDTIVALREPAEVQELGRTILARLGTPLGMFPVEAIFRRAADFALVQMSRFAGSVAPDRGVVVDASPLPQFEPKAVDAVQQLVTLGQRGHATVWCDNQGEVDRLGELIAQVCTAGGLATPNLEVAIGLVHQGFCWRPSTASRDEESPAFVLTSGHEVFHRYQHRRRIRRVVTGRPIDSFLDLQANDYVVHVVHGIGKFVGMKTMVKGDSRKAEEFLTLRFADDAVMHVPVSQIDLVQKYVGSGGAAPPLSKLGGTRWKATTARVAEAVDDLAAELLRVQAQRESQPGVSYPGDTSWQKEFESAFPYAETPDQSSGLAEIKRDMARARPMDRLLCGDVGYGKTELAVRAAFKVVEFGKQVAVLVPTTVLAEQHEQTFRERLADYPFVVESVSRFKSKKQQAEVLARARKGQVDILIGTHRLLSKDVRFADLGLVVIDEEQRFGVEHKERLKQLRSTVDVLTLTATPIPRTLHMSLIGLRDISALATPPLDRRAITTRVTTWDANLVRAAILREMNRDGQVYFVHNRVQTIRQTADRIAAIVPEARLLIGHGQMPPDELEDVMVRFVRHEADVLVCTTIIEAGLDIPNVNTILIDSADRFGLADLHQLRGRVGRYKHRAYCYLLLSPERPLTDTAAKRLKAIEEFSELGAGFRIAMRDLEIRGAGNILGPEQSGHIAAVGYEMYCRLLEQAVRRMKGEAPAPTVDVHLELNVEAYLPKHYIPSDRQRMEAYRRVTSCRTPQEVSQLEADLVDAFGRLPREAATLLTLAEIRVRAAPWGIRTIIRREPDLIFTIDEVKRVEPLFDGATGSVRLVDTQTIHWRLSDVYFHGDTLLTVLRGRLMRAAGERSAAASAG
ncbi:MAG: transcription-repair coupling factor [Phycisphaerae bacterium]|nr:transcription-repair coupling factor [Phycisphaerae bacterium]